MPGYLSLGAAWTVEQRKAMKTADQMRRLLRQRVKAAGSMAACAKQMGLNLNTLDLAVNGRSGVGPKVAGLLGWKLVTAYIPVSKWDEDEAGAVLARNRARGAKTWAARKAEARDAFARRMREVRDGATTGG